MAYFKIAVNVQRPLSILDGFTMKESRLDHRMKNRNSGPNAALPLSSCIADILTD
jgi:hypothetical protein